MLLSLHCDNDVTYAKSLDFLLKDRANIRKILFNAKISDFLTQPFCFLFYSISTPTNVNVNATIPMPKPTVTTKTNTEVL